MASFPNISLEQLIALPSEHTTIITANNRLAAFIKGLWRSARSAASVSSGVAAASSTTQSAQTHAVISLPTIVPYKAWLQSLSERMAFYSEPAETSLASNQLELFASSEDVNQSPIWLNETAQRWYWQQVLLEHGVLSKPAQLDYVAPLGSSKEAESSSLTQDLPEEDLQGELLNIPAAAASLSQAHRLQAEWDIDVLENERNPEYEAFCLWRKHYHAHLKQINAWDTPRQAEEILASFDKGIHHLPRYCILMGFYSLSAYQQRLLAQLSKHGVKIFHFTHHLVQTSSVDLYRAEDTKHELYSALQWAKQIQAQHPDWKVAIAMPQLQEHATLVQRYLNHIFAGQKPHWHLAVGRALSEWALIRSVLAWLSLLLECRRKFIDIQHIGNALLKAEFAFSLDEQERLALWDRELREGVRRSLTSRDFLDGLEQIVPEKRAIFEHYLTKWESRVCGCADWAQLYRETLVAFGFPGTSPLSSTQYQLCHAFEQVLKKFAQLDEMLPALKAEQAWSLFVQQLQQTSFQVQRTPEVTLDVVGLYEIEGGQWDAVWVLGLTDDVLPQMPNPNPYLPIQSQRRVNVVHASPESEMQWASQIFAAILRTAPRIILSYPSFKGEEVLRHSSFLKPYLSQVQDLPPRSFEVKDALVLETIQDSQGLPKQGVMRGGYSTLEKQSKNPLWAYASARLQLSQLANYPEHELNIQVRGNFLHKAMEIFYSQCRTQQDLQRDSTVQTELDAALQEAANLSLRDVHSVTLKQLTINRARDILNTVIEFDRDKREPFSVYSLEQRYAYESEGVHFTFRVDRIDQTASGDLVFIDYKSGRLKSFGKYYSNWVERSRLADLQLPLYAALLGVTSPDKVAGVTFASLARDKTVYEGLWQSQQYSAQKADSILGMDKWVSLTQQWQEKLNILFREIAQGEASNRYLSHEDMAYCDVQPFLRLHHIEEGNDE